MYVGTQEDTTAKVLSYVRPFEPLIYVFIAMSSVIIVISFVFISYLRMNFSNNKYTDPEDDISLYKASWYMISALLQQGIHSYFIFNKIYSGLK